MRTIVPRPKYFIGTLIGQAARHLVAYYNQALAPIGVTAQQLMALVVLYRETELSLGQFAERVGIGKAAAVTMIKRLEGLGLVSRRPHSRDARLNVLKLTEKALKLAPKAWKEVIKLEKTIELAIGVSDLQTMIRGLSVIRDLKL